MLFNIFTVLLFAVTVQRILKQKDRLDRLRNMGDFQHNIDVLCKGEGQLIVGRRVSDGTFGAGDFLPCKFCLVFFSKKELWRHVVHCDFRLTPLASASGDASVQRAGVMLLSGAGVGISTSPSSDRAYMSAIINQLSNDTVTSNIANDFLLTNYDDDDDDELICTARHK